MDGASIAAELSAQLAEQVDGLAEVEEALAACPYDADLLDLKQQLEAGIVHLRDSLQEVQQAHTSNPAQHPHELHGSAQQKQDDAGLQRQSHQQQSTFYQRPEWMQDGAQCWFRFSDGQWHPGIVTGWRPEQQMPVQVHFAYPSR